MFLITLFLLSGVASPLIVSQLSALGACEPSTMLSLYPCYIGVCFCWLIKERVSNSQKRYDWRNIIRVSVIDALSQGVNFYGLNIVGSAIFSIVYSSVTIWTALFSFIWLRKNVRPLQWMGCLLVTFGIAITASGSREYGISVLFGVVLIIIGSCAHSFTYVLMEEVLISSRDPEKYVSPSPGRLAALMGSVNTSIYTVYMMAYTLPNGQTLFIDPVIAHGSRYFLISVFFLLLMLSSFVHAFTFFKMLRSTGSVTVAIIKGVQTISIFIASHLIFCSTESLALANPTQCFTINKVIAVIVVSSGVFIYSSSKKRK